MIHLTVHRRGLYSGRAHTFGVDIRVKIDEDVLLDGVTLATDFLGFELEIIRLKDVGLLSWTSLDSGDKMLG